MVLNQLPLHPNGEPRSRRGLWVSAPTVSLIADADVWVRAPRYDSTVVAVGGTDLSPVVDLARSSRRVHPEGAIRGGTHIAVSIASLSGMWGRLATLVCTCYGPSLRASRNAR